MKNLTDQQKGSLMAFLAVLFITPDSLFIRLSNVDTWGLVFYRGIIPFLTVFLGMLIIFRLSFFKILASSGYHGLIYNKYYLIFPDEHTTSGFISYKGRFSSFKNSPKYSVTLRINNIFDNRDFIGRGNYGFYKESRSFNISSKINF